MSLNRILMKYLGWCPGRGSASEFGNQRFGKYWSNVDFDLQFPIAILSIVGLLVIVSVFTNPLANTIVYEPLYTGEVLHSGAEIVVSRSERYWQDSYSISGEFDYFRPTYHVSYDISFYETTDTFTLQDQLLVNYSHYRWRGGNVARSNYDNVKVEYISANKSITIQINEAKKGDGGPERYYITLYFESPFINKFIEKPPKTTCKPNILLRGYQTNLLITIDPFTIADLEKFQGTRIETWLTILVDESRFVTANPETNVDIEEVGNWWEYGPNDASIGPLESVYDVTIGLNDGGVVFRTYIVLQYSKPLHTFMRPIFDGGNVVFLERGTMFQYQHEHGIRG